MAASAPPRSSSFTFESTVHSSNVLLRLDEQRRRDALCDVTVLVEGLSFRAHSSVLASCSEYFAQRISTLTHHGAVISLPQEVTVAGFEPLLKFAYTSKLLFGKDDVLEVRNSATILGFRDLDEGCFEFLLPKFFSSSQSSAAFPRKTCCEQNCKRASIRNGVTDCDGILLDEKEVKPVGESQFQQEASSLCNKSSNSQSRSTSASEGDAHIFHQSPKYRKFQQACGKETCSERSGNTPASVISNGCDLPCSPCCSSKTESEAELLRNSSSNPVRQNTCKGDDSGSSETQDKPIEEAEERGQRWRPQDQDMSLEGGVSSLDFYKGSSAAPPEGPSGLILHHCPLKTLGVSAAGSGSMGQDGFAMDVTQDEKTLVSIHPERGQTDRGKRPAMAHRSSVEREVAEHLAGRMGSDRLMYQDVRRPQDLHLNTSCSFNQDPERGRCPWKGAELSECEGASQSGVSSFNSGEDGDSETETEGDSEASAREKAKQMKLPFPVDWIVDLSRNDFQQLLKQQVFTREQLDFVHDMRRRSKNRLAAQRCRKRKLDCIYNLQCEINKLKSEREKLMTERSRLSQLKLQTCHSVSVLCQKVCSEAELQPDQLQVLAKYSSADCPLSSVFPHIDALLSRPELQRRLHASGSLHQYGPPQDAPCSSTMDLVSSGHQEPSLDQTAGRRPGPGPGLRPNSSQ